MGTENFGFICSSITQFKIVFHDCSSSFLSGLFFMDQIIGNYCSRYNWCVPFFFIALSKDKKNKIKLILIIIFLGVGFWVPFFILESLNQHLSGITANHFYSGNNSDLQAPLFGKFWGNSTTGVLLIWSLISSQVILYL